MELNASERLLFIVDDAGRERNAPVAMVLDAPMVAVGDLHSEDVEAYDALVIDVGLDDVTDVQKLKRALARVPARVARIFAVDQGDRGGAMQAGALGATFTLRRPLSPQSLEGAVGRLKRDTAALEELPAIVGESISSAAGALGAMFETLNAGGDFGGEAVDAASGEVVEAINESGFPAWLDAVRSHHQGTFQHCLIVTGVLSNFGRGTGMSRRDVVALTRAGLLHDIGKASIPVAILDKPDRLTEAEFDVVRTHPVIGYDFLRQHGAVDDEVLNAVRGHHEFLDGTGYPDALEGARIPDLTRIVTVCDIFGALAERRAYKPPMPPQSAIAVLRDMADRGKIEKSLVRALEISSRLG